MIWAARQRPIVASGYRPAIAARQQTATIAPPVISRYGLVKSQPGMVGRG